MPLFGPPTVESMKKRRDINGLLKELVKSNTLEQLHAIQALGELRAFEAVDPLVTLLQIENNAFFPNAIGPEIVKALALIHDPRAIPTIIQGLFHPYEPIGTITIRSEAEKAIPQFGNLAIKPLVDALQDKSISRQNIDDISDLLMKIGDRNTLDLWISLLKSDNPVVQRKSVQQLGKLKDLRAVEPLLMLLENQKATMRGLAASMSAQSVNNRTIDLSLTRQHDQYLEVQQNVIKVLIQLGDKRAAEPLIALFLEGDNYIQYEMTCAMHVYGDDRAVPKLCEGLVTGDDRTRCEAAKALSDIGNAQAIKPLIDMIVDPFKNVRLAAANALVTFYRSGKITPDQQKSILKVKPQFEEKHSDYKESHQDIPGCLDPHSDISETHIDKGIGIEL